MADSLKNQKLAAARKKLKEYQQKSHKPIKAEPKYEDLHISDALSSSTHSSNNGSFDIVPLEAVSNNFETNEAISPFQNYFEPHSENVDLNQPNFFDSLSNELNDNFTAVNCGLEDDKSQVRQDYMINTDAYTFEYPEIKQNDLYKHLHTSDHQKHHPFVSLEDAKKLSEYIEDSNSIKDNLVRIENPSAPTQTVINSNVESLRQLSSQITELIKDEPASEAPEISELERRNLELAGLLEQEHIKSQTANAQIRDFQNRLQQLQLEMQQLKTDYEHRLNREMGPLQEQLQCHAQTVGILIGEKTELSTSLSQSQLLAKQKLSECEELQGRLKTSRSRVADLEKDLQALKAAKLKSEQNNIYEGEMQTLRKEYQAVKERFDEVSQDLLESQEKLSMKIKENLELQREVQEVTHHLSLAKVKIEQITAGGNLQAESQVEILTQQKLTLEKHVTELSEALKSTGEERDQASVQYQQYVQQLNGQAASLAAKLQSVTTENENLAKREQNLVQHISELEKHLQKLQDDYVNPAVNRGTSNETKKNLDVAMESLQNLQIDKARLEELYENVVSERDDLLQDLACKKELVEKLETDMETLQSDKPDNAKLLAAIESDKVAASRAVEQNSQLKQQLEEMQQAFVRMSNDKLDLTDQLTSEEYRSKELTDKLGHVEHQLHTLSDAIAIKDSELTHMRDTLTHQNKQMLQNDQLNDRLRHYEAQNGSAHVLQIELQKAQEQVEILTKENLVFKEEFNKMNYSMQDQLSRERLQLLGTTNEDNISLNIEVGSQTVSDGDDSKSVDLSMLDKEVAMKHLEDKFTRTMSDIANLTEEKQRLEHIVMQLQDETETIGEYIALYQHQRGILQQRTQEKDYQLKHLAYDRETVKKKLDILNQLVKKLMVEKGALSSEFLEQHKTLNSEKQELCTEHAKLHEEMHKIHNLNENINQLNENNNVQQNTETAEEIIALLADIKTSNLIQPKESSVDFHPCGWCSGQLLTV